MFAVEAFSKAEGRLGKACRKLELSGCSKRKKLASGRDPVPLGNDLVVQSHVEMRIGTYRRALEARLVAIVERVEQELAGADEDLQALEGGELCVKKVELEHTLAELSEEKREIASEVEGLQELVNVRQQKLQVAHQGVSNLEETLRKSEEEYAQAKKALAEAAAMKEDEGLQRKTPGGKEEEDSIAEEIKRVLKEAEQAERQIALLDKTGAKPKLEGVEAGDAANLELNDALSDISKAIKKCQAEDETLHKMVQERTGRFENLVRSCASEYDRSIDPEHVRAWLELVQNGASPSILQKETCDRLQTLGVLK